MRTPEDAPTDPDKLIRLGTIATVDLAAGRAVVELDDGVLTPPLKWKERRAGDTATWSPPSIGEQVELRCPAGEITAGLIDGAIPCDANPPAGNSPTELIRFKDGAVLSYDPVGHALTFALPAGATLAITAPGGTTITGDLHCTGTITADTDVLAAGISARGHRHGGVQAGAATTAGPQ